MPVNPEIAAALLSWAAAFDNREVTRTAAIAWAEALDDVVNLADGKAAITQHARNSSEYLKPLHVNAEVRRIRKERVERIGDGGIPPAELADKHYVEAAWRREFARAIGDGDQFDTAEKRACAAVGVEVPAVIEGGRAMPAVGHLTRRVPGEAS